MRYSGIGGQAVMEGVMMKNGSRYAVAVRKPNQEIVIESSEYAGIGKNRKIRNMPIVRGVLNFIESLSLGFRTLSYSASFFEEEEEKAEKTMADAGVQINEVTEEEREKMKEACAGIYQKYAEDYGLEELIERMEAIAIEE